MKVQWKNLLTKTVMWLATEILLNCLGLDNLADYSEFVFERYEVAEFSTPEVSHPIRFPIHASNNFNITLT